MPRIKRKSTVEDCIRLTIAWVKRNNASRHEAWHFLIGAMRDAQPKVSKALAELDEEIVSAAERWRAEWQANRDKSGDSLTPRKDGD